MKNKQKKGKSKHNNCCYSTEGKNSEGRLKIPSGMPAGFPLLRLFISVVVVEVAV